MEPTKKHYAMLTKRLSVLLSHIREQGVTLRDEDIDLYYKNLLNKYFQYEKMFGRSFRWSLDSFKLLAFSQEILIEIVPTNDHQKTIIADATILALLDLIIKEKKVAISNDWISELARLNMRYIHFTPGQIAANKDVFSIDELGIYCAFKSIEHFKLPPKTAIERTLTAAEKTLSIVKLMHGGG